MGSAMSIGGGRESFVVAAVFKRESERKIGTPVKVMWGVSSSLSRRNSRLVGSD